MKKTRFLALALVVAIMLMGAGYAFWMEELEINTTVNTGKLDFKFSDTGHTKGDYVTNSPNHRVSGAVDVRVGNDNILDIKLVNMHPGSFFKAGFRMENTGTIDLKLEDFVIAGDMAKLTELTIDGMSVEEYFKGLENTYIAAGESVYKEVEFRVNKCADEESFEEGRDYAFQVKANVKQYNDDGSCRDDEEQPPRDPECIGLKWDGTYTTHHGNKIKITGRVYAEYDDGTTKDIKTYNKHEMNNNKEIEVNHKNCDCNKIVLKNDKGTLKISYR